MKLDHFRVDIFNGKFLTLGANNQREALVVMYSWRHAKTDIAKCVLCSQEIKSRFGCQKGHEIDSGTGIHVCFTILIV